MVSAIFEKRDEVVLYDDRRLSTKRLGLTNRFVGRDGLVL
jgi:hypothetical protein